MLFRSSLMNFHQWVKPEVISYHTTLLAAGRDNFSFHELRQQAEKLNRLYGTRVQLIDMPKLLISSQQIRKSIKENHPEKIRDFLPERVLEYILEHKLYQKNI